MMSWRSIKSLRAAARASLILVSNSSPRNCWRSSFSLGADKSRTCEKVMTSVMSLLLTTAAMPLITSGSAAKAPRQSDDSDSNATVNNIIRRGRTIVSEFAKQPENFLQPLFDCRANKTREFARDKYKIPAPRRHQFVLPRFDPGDFLFGRGEFDLGGGDKVFHGLRGS